MQHSSNPTVCNTPSLIQRDGQAYLLHGAVHEISGQGPLLDSSLLDKLTHRRLKRLERVLASHGGKLIKQLRHSLLASFHSAEAALIGACEMQRRCAVIPQLADTQLALKIGIHASTGKRLSNHPVDPAEATAAKLSTLIEDAGIVLSETVITGLPVDFKEKSRPVANDGSEIAAFTLDWNLIPLQQASRRTSKKTNMDVEQLTSPGLQFILRQGQQRFSFDCRQSLITIGRDPGNHVTVNSPKASRKHCRIVYRLGNYVLVDVSTNGTYLCPENGTETLIQKNMTTLVGRGRIGFGQAWREGSPHAFEFEVAQSD